MNLASDTFLVRFQTGPTSDMFRQKGAENSDTKLLPNVILVTILRQYCFSHGKDKIEQVYEFDNYCDNDDFKGSDDVDVNENEDMIMMMVMMKMH